MINLKKIYIKKVAILDIQSGNKYDWFSIIFFAQLTGNFC